MSIENKIEILSGGDVIFFLSYKKNLFYNGQSCLLCSVVEEEIKLFPPCV